MTDDDLADRVRRAVCGTALGPDHETVCDMFEPQEIDRFVAAILEAIPEPSSEPLVLPALHVHFSNK